MSPTKTFIVSNHYARCPFSGCCWFGTPADGVPFRSFASDGLDEEPVRFDLKLLDLLQIEVRELRNLLPVPPRPLVDHEKKAGQRPGFFLHDSKADIATQGLFPAA